MHTLPLQIVPEARVVGIFQASPGCFWKQAFCISRACEEAGPQDSGCEVWGLPLEPLMAGLLHCELRMADSALWIGCGQALGWAAPFGSSRLIILEQPWLSKAQVAKGLSWCRAWM